MKKQLSEDFSLVADTDAKTESLELNQLPNTCHSDFIKSVSNSGEVRAGNWGCQGWKCLGNPWIWSHPCGPFPAHSSLTAQREEPGCWLKNTSKKGKATMVDYGLDSKTLEVFFNLTNSVMYFCWQAVLTCSFYPLPRSSSKPPHRAQDARGG